MAASAGLISTIDPTIGTLLSDIRSSLEGVNSIFNQLANPNLQQASFFNTGSQIRKFPTVRLDFNLAKNHHLENIWNYQQFRSTVDFLNGVDPAFPGFPNFGSQDSNRFSNSTAWRWTISQNIVNEARFGLTGGTSLFRPGVNSSQFENQGGVALQISGAATGITNPTVSTSPSRRNSPVKQFSDVLSWIKGNHGLSFGSNVTRVNHWNQTNTVVPTIGFGISGTLTGDSAAFAAFLPLQRVVSQQANAAALYATLVARINSVTGNVRLSEETDKYQYLGDLITRTQMTEYGFFGQDTWRVRPNLTVTGGLRWEVQGPFQPLNNSLSRIESFASIYGVSGEGNLFMPGTLTGQPTKFVEFSKGEKAFNTQYGNFAPSLGISWSPSTDSDGFWHKLFGNSGQTVLRAGFSTAFTREGTSSFTSIFAGNPGGTLSANQTTGGTPFPLGFGNHLRNGIPAPPPQVSAPVLNQSLPIEPIYPFTPSITDGSNTFLPDMKTGHVRSWTFSIQRELTSNMVFEVRYVGNRGNDLWRQVNLNEVNVFENGFLQEFRLAQQNLIANLQAGRGNQFRYQGEGTGTFPLPNLLGFFTGKSPLQAGNCTTVANCNTLYSGTLWANSSFTTPLNPLSANVLTFAGLISGTANDSIFNPNRITAGLPANFFVVNPGTRGGAFLFTNGGKSTYDGLTVELRRRFAKGLLVQANYTFSKALSNMYANNDDIADQPATLREGQDMRRGVTPFDITHSFKTNFIYELPVGRGQTFFSGANGWLDRLVGGWGFNGNIRIQSGSPFSLGNVQLVGMTAKELQESIGVYRDQADADGIVRGNVFVLPQDIRDNTFRAFSTGFSTSGPVYTQGTPTGRYIAPAGLGCLQGFAGGCGFNNLVLKGPAFFRSDLSIVKKIRFTETTNLELRGEFLNAFNNINFLVGNASNEINSLGGTNAATFGRFTNAYQDVSTTNDPGGRLVQLVVRFNF